MTRSAVHSLEAQSTAQVFANSVTQVDASAQAPLRVVDNGLEPKISIIARISRLFFIVFTIIALGYGARFSAMERFTPAEGPGYAFGIIGGVLMLVLLLYPLRKRFSFLDRLGGAPAWFRVHMALGIVGPIFILYHSGFSLGATNSNVAMFSMLLVSTSGIAGRYMYGKIHNGLYGTKTDLQELLGTVTSMLGEIEKDVGGAGGNIAKELTLFGAKALRPRRTVLGSLVQAVTTPFATRFAQTRILVAVRRATAINAAAQAWTRRERRAHYQSARKHVIAYLYGVVKASQLSFYERVFGMWHVLHVPLFFLLIVTGVVHVIAVHLY